MLDGVRDELGGRRFEVVTDNSIVDVFEESLRMLQNIAKRTAVAREEKARQDNEDSYDGGDSVTSGLQPSVSSLLSSRPFNVRVDVTTFGAADGQIQAEQAGDDVELGNMVETGDDVRTLVDG